MLDSVRGSYTEAPYDCRLSLQANVAVLGEALL